MPASSNNPPPVSYSDKVGYRDDDNNNDIDDIEALASKALTPISDFPPGAEYDDDHSLSSEEDPNDDDDISISDDEESHRDELVLRKKTSDILNEFEDFVQDVDSNVSPTREMMKNIRRGSGGGGSGGNASPPRTKSRGRNDTIKSRITAGGGGAVSLGGTGGGGGSLQRDWSYDKRNLHDVSFGESRDDGVCGFENTSKYKKRGLFKYAIPILHTKKFKYIAFGVSVVFVLILIVSSISGKGGDIGEEDENFDDVVTWFYKQTTCSDHPMAMIPCNHESGFCDCDWLSHTGRVNLRHARCGADTTYKKKNGEFLMIKEVCPATCDECEVTEDAATATTITQIQPKPNEEIVRPPESTETISIDTSECTDHPTAIIKDCSVDHPGSICNCHWIEMTGRPNLHAARCEKESPLKNAKGETLFVKDVCRKSCGACDGGGSSSNMESQTQVQTPSQVEQESVVQQSPQVEEPVVQQSPQIEESVQQVVEQLDTSANTISIDTSECTDHPTAIIHDCSVDHPGSICNCHWIEMTGRPNLHEARCEKESPLKNAKGETLLVKDVCRKSCGVCGGDSSITSSQMQGMQENAAADQTLLQEPESETANGLEDMTNWNTPVVLNNEESVSSKTEGQENEKPAFSTVEEAPSPLAGSSNLETSAETPSFSTTEAAATAQTTVHVFSRGDGWIGYSESMAIDFCSQKKLTLCTYEEVCPEGSGKPAVGPPTHDTWVPILNDWVQVASEKPCDTWSQLHGGPPPWANAGAAIEEITRRAYCCEEKSTDGLDSNSVLVSNTVETTAEVVPASNTVEKPAEVVPAVPEPSGFEEQQAYNAVALNVEPKWFDRSSGWEGTTHQAALQFCASNERVLCPYAAYCPLGPKSPIPYGGFKTERFGTLAPAIATGGKNMWIRVGKDEKGDGEVCTFVELEASWGQDKSNEEVTRHIMCCKS